ncbi:MAG: glycosyltransferase family 4 protein, partial [Patescibacteria group bacterium]
DKCIKESYLKSALGMLEFYWQRFFLMAYGKVDTFHAPSLYMKNIAVSSGISSEKIFDLVYPIEAREDSNGTEKVNEEYLLYFGRLSEEKGIDVLIRALSRTKIGIKLKIAGEGELKDGLMKISDALGLTKRIEFLGFQNGEKLEKLISGAEAVVIPSLWPENMPYSLLESMASGKTIIASKTGGIPERIVDESSGYLFSIGNINELAEKIDSAVSEKNAMLGQKARDSIKNFNTKKHYEELVKMYNSLIFAKLKHY